MSRSHFDDYDQDDWNEQKDRENRQRARRNEKRRHDNDDGSPAAADEKNERQRR